MMHLSILQRIAPRVSAAGLQEVIRPTIVELFGKISRDVEVAFDDIDHFEATVNVSEEYYVFLEGSAPEIETEFRPVPPHLERKRGEMVAIGADAEKKFAGDFRIAAGPIKLSLEVSEIPLGGSPKVSSSHTESP